jgi:hypothetical protein
LRCSCMLRASEWFFLTGYILRPAVCSCEGVQSRRRWVRRAIPLRGSCGQLSCAATRMKCGSNRIFRSNASTCSRPASFRCLSRVPRHVTIASSTPVESSNYRRVKKTCPPHSRSSYSPHDVLLSSFSSSNSATSNNSSSNSAVGSLSRDRLF